MKKSELKSLLKVITEEVIAAKQKQLTETKGLSGMQKASESTEHTETIADSKDLTGPAPKEKTEGTKLPKVKKPANPSVGGLKEDIMSMIREVIEEVGVDEGRKPLTYDPATKTLSGIGSKFMKPDPTTAGQFITTKEYTIKTAEGDMILPIGTKVTPPKTPGGAYIKKEKNPVAAGTPASTSAVAAVGKSRETELAVADILKFKPDATTEEITAELTARAERGEKLNLAPAVIANAIATASEDKPQSSVGVGDDAETAAAETTAAEKRIQANVEKSLQRAMATKKPVTPEKQAVRDRFAAYRQGLKK